MNVRFMNNVAYVRHLFKGEIMLSNKARERVTVAVNNILSGENNCGTLANAVARGDGDYFWNAISPIVSVYDAEYNQMKAERDALSARGNDADFIIEYIKANNPDAYNAAVTLLNERKKANG